MATREVYQFREFTLDVGERRLSRGEVPVHLPPKAHDLLVMLVQQPGRLLTKDELLARIWPDAFVEEGIARGFHLPRFGDFGGRAGDTKPDHGEVDMLPYGA
jgi:hypothetical protein